MECRDQNQISIPDQIDMETQVLDLSGNNLQILPREVFARHGLLNLQKLHLSGCNIGQIGKYLVSTLRLYLGHLGCIHLLNTRRYCDNTREYCGNTYEY